MRRYLPAVLAAALAGSGCGYIGGPLTPLANVPSAVTDLAALQRGPSVIAHFTVPVFTTEHIAIKGAVTLDLRIGVWPERASVDVWAFGAKQIASYTMTGGMANYLIPCAEWAGKEVVIAARVVGPNGKGSAWSSYQILPIVPAPDRPEDFRAATTPEGVHLTWRSTGEHFRILRKAGEDGQYAVAAPALTAREWTDTAATPGTPYSYLVQSFVPLGNNREAQSELAEVKFTPEIPPPAAPTALVAVPAPASVELTWEASTGDATGYRIYRATGSGDFAKIADVNGIPSYSDHAIEHGKTYRYAVSALDAAGREGPRSAIKEVAMP